VSLGDADGFIGRVDFLWREQRVVGESDGMGKYTDILDLWVASCERWACLSGEYWLAKRRYDARRE